MKKRTICLSFDFEECDLPREQGVTFSLEEGMSLSAEGAGRLLDMLARQGVKATFFCTLNFARLAPEIMQRLRAEGHEIAAHGVDHFHPGPQDPVACKTGLEALYDVKIAGYRPPRFMPVDDTVLKSAEYVYNSSINPTFIPGRYRHLGMPRTVFEKDGVWQIPVSVTPIIRFPLFWMSLHLLPEWLYRFFAFWTLRHDGYLVTYFHPWEFSSLSARADELKVPRLIRVNLGLPLLGRLERFIVASKKNGYSFSTLAENMI